MRRSLLASFSLGFWQSLLKGSRLCLVWIGGGNTKSSLEGSVIAMLSFLVWEIEEYLDL
ncbi:hypothetical protein M758_9G115900 [Ceratodon purpureus]|nr:hypothetical protein M758_9G115900 [Ceratodon purpureus]